jgi:hypothetical protein
MVAEEAISSQLSAQELETVTDRRRLTAEGSSKLFLVDIVSHFYDI